MNERPALFFVRNQTATVERDNQHIIFRCVYPVDADIDGLAEKFFRRQTAAGRRQDEPARTMTNRLPVPSL